MGSKRRSGLRVAVIAGLVLAVAATTGVGIAQPAAWRIVQSSDGTLYLLAGGQRFSLEPDLIADDELAGYDDGGDLGSSLPSPASSSAAPVPTSAVAVAPPAPATPLPTTVPLPTPAGISVGSRSNPVPLGTATALADGWQLTVTSSQPDASQSLLAANPSHPPATAGTQPFLASVRLTNSGSAAQAFHADLRLRTVGLSPAPYVAVPDACGALPNPLSSAPVGAGQTITGNVCWLVKSADAPSLVLYDAPPLLATDAAVTRTYFALHR